MMSEKKCETCGNVYDKTFDVHMNGKSHTFDCFECAITALAPHCLSCGVQVISHGVELEGSIYCCENCARKDKGAFPSEALRA